MGGRVIFEYVSQPESEKKKGKNGPRTNLIDKPLLVKLTQDMNHLAEVNPEIEYEEFSGIILDETDPNSIHNLVPLWLSNRIKALPKEWFTWDLKKLKNHVKPGKIVEALRYSFWLEYSNTVYNGKDKMVLYRVWSPICTDYYFHEEVCKTPLLLCWMLQPPQKYARCMEALLDHSVDRLREILDLPIVDKKGKINHQVAKLIMSIHNRLEDRVQGAIVQKTETKTLSMNFSSSMRNATEAQLDKRLRELRNAERNLLEAGETINAGADEEDSGDRDAGEAAQTEEESSTPV